jgi:hypothetical protein
VSVQPSVLWLDLSNNCSGGETTPGPVLDHQLEIGNTYTIRPDHGLLEPAMLIGRTLYEVGSGDPRNYIRRAYAVLDRDGWWRPTWAGGLPVMRLEDCLALPEDDRPL